jgi:hypothetical protein
VQTPRRFLDFVVDGKAMYDQHGCEECPAPSSPISLATVYWRADATLAAEAMERCHPQFPSPSVYAMLLVIGSMPVSSSAPSCPQDGVEMLCSAPVMQAMMREVRMAQS